MKYKKIILRTLFATVFFVAGYLISSYQTVIQRNIFRFLGRPTVSVIMSTYNRAEALPHAVESVLNQTFDDFEFIIVDDGSTDNTSKQLAFYAQKDPRIIILTNEKNEGLIYSLNRALDAAHGKYIVRMDDDDKSVPHRLERQVWAMDLNPDIAVLGGGILGKDAQPKQPIGIPEIEDPDEVELNTYFSSGLAHPTIIIRRRFLEKHHIRYDMAYTYAEDCGLYKDVLAKGGRVSAMKEPVLFFGYVTGLQKPKKYSYIQSESFKKVQKEKIKAFFDVPEDMLGAFSGDEVRCRILKQIAPVNKEKNILNQKTIEKRIEVLCRSLETPAYTINVTHPYWKDSFALDEKRVNFYRRSATTETGKIIAEDDKTVTISWDNWDEEVYTKVSPTEWKYLKNKNGSQK